MEEHDAVLSEMVIQIQKLNQDMHVFKSMHATLP